MGKSPSEKLKSLLSADRGVSPVIAVALLILIAIGFAVAIQGVGGDIVDGVQQPPEANIDGNPQDGEIILTVESVDNADELEVRTDADNGPDEPDLDTESGATTTVDFDDADTQITVVAINRPDDERVVYTYELPDADDE